VSAGPLDGSVKKAKTSCEQSGNNCDYHLAGAGKMFRPGSGSERKVVDLNQQFMPRRPITRSRIRLAIGVG
jgi:hypothetical protein